MFGDEPIGFHATNLVWYAVSAVGAYYFFREVILLFRQEWASRASLLALCGIVLFLLHPAHVEAVVWVASRKDLIGGALSLLAAGTIAHGIRHGWRGRQMGLGMCFFFLACFGKAASTTSALFITALILGAWHSPPARQYKNIVYLLLLWGIVFAVSLVHMKTGESTGIRIDNHPGFILIIDRASRIAGTLAQLLVFPYPLGIYHDVYRSESAHWIVSFLISFLVCVSLWVWLTRQRLWAFGVLVAVAPWPVYLQLIPFTTWSLASERFLFISVAGMSLILIDLLGRIENRWKAIGIVLFLVLPCAMLTWRRVSEWEFGRDLMKVEYARQPEFHNAIRDHVIYTLLPAKQYDEARRISLRIKREYAVEALLNYIRTEEAYKIYRDETNERDALDSARLEFCIGVSMLRLSVEKGYQFIVTEKDISYNNLLRSLERQLDQRFGESKRVCRE